MRLAFAACLILATTPAGASILVEVAPSGAAYVARAGIVQEWTPRGMTREWPGVEIPLAMSVTDERVAVAGVGGVLLLIGGEVSRVPTDGRVTELLETPSGLLALEGQTGRIGWIRAGRVVPFTEAGRDAAFLRHHDGAIYVTSRVAQHVTRISLADGSTITGAISSAPSDMEVDASGVYLTMPGEGRIEILETRTLEPSENFRLGGAPVDLALGGSGGPVRAGPFLVADPGASAVIRDERSQSRFQAFLRGFLRGFLGLGLARAEAVRPGGRPDRVAARGNAGFAQDSVSGRIWHIEGKRAHEIGRSPGGAFAVDGNGSLVHYDAATAELRWYDSK